MIVERLYPTAQTLAGGIELTDNAGALIQQYGEDFANPYFMGYVDGNDLPDCLKITKMTIDIDAEEVRFEPYEIGAIPWGFYATEPGIFDTILTSFTTIIDGGNVTGNTSWCLINKAFMHKYNASQYLRLLLDVINTTEPLQYNSLSTQTIITTVTDVNQWINGDKPLSISFGNESDDVEYNTDSDGFINHEFNGINYKIRCRGYVRNVKMNYGDTTNNKYYKEFFKYNIFDKTVYVSSFGSTGLTDADILQINIDPTTKMLATSGHTINFLEISDDRRTAYFFGNVSNVIKFDDFPGYNKFAIIGGLWVYGNNFNSTMFSFGFNIDSLTRLTDFVNKIDLTMTTINDVVPPNIYYDTTNSVSLFTPENVPLHERVSDEYTTIIKRLQLWQLYDVDITVNDFDVEEDLPGESGDGLPDIPGDPDIPDAEGDDIENQPNRRVSAPTNFITYYVLNDSILQQFGKLLWGEMLDDTGNYWQNFATQVQYETGSYNVQSIFSFLVSLHIYPFSVGTLPICISSGSDIKIGSGKVPIPVGGDVRRLTSVIGDLHVGSVTLKLDDSYKDFRDIYNTTVTAYLPYCGAVDLNPAEVIGNTLNCFYSVDFSTGACIAFVDVLNDGKRYNVAVKDGNIGAMLPLTATNAGQVLAQRSIDISQGNMHMIDTLTGGLISAVKGYSDPSQIAKGLADFVKQNDRGNIMQQNRVMRSAISPPMLSGGGGIASFMQPPTAYIQVRRGQYYDPPSYEMPHTRGYTSATKGRLGSFKLSSGLTYIECNNVDVTSLPCPNHERQIIKQLLDSGVYI